ncbi:MAG: FxsA family protein [Alphaproteobacteria bacterium]
MLLVLLVILVGIPIGEIWLLLTVSDQIGAVATIALVVLTAVLGSAIIRMQGLGVLAQVRGALGDENRQGVQGGDVSNTLIGAAIDGVFLLVAGALLLTPGFFTDAVGFALLIPPLRHIIARAIWARVKSRQWTAGAPEAPHRAGPTIDAEFHEVDDPVSDPRNGPENSDSPWTPGPNR